MEVSNETVSNYEVQNSEIRKSGSSACARALLLGILLGPFGLIWAIMGAKDKYVITITLFFKDGKRSLIEVNEKIYKQIMKELF